MKSIKFDKIKINNLKIKKFILSLLLLAKNNNKIETIHNY